MNSNVTRIKELNNILLAIEMELDILESKYSKIELDLVFLEKTLETLIDNYQILKTKGLVISLKEYKNNVLESVYVEDKILELKRTVFSINYEIEKKTKSKNFYENEWDLLTKIEEEEKKILLFINPNEEK